MTNSEDARCTQLESASRLLRSRERSLQQLAQSPQSPSREAAEQELARVREELAATYVQLRQLRATA